MSSSPPPTKPPRGVKQGKETSGLLMSVIRTLSASETNEQREKERAKLEKEYKKSDAKLDELVAQNAAEIMEVMQKFSQAQAALSAWGQRSDAATARLGACRQLLRLRRDDLRRLWADARASAHALQMLTDIELVVSSERELSAALSSGLVLSAAHTLRGALHTHAASLAHVTALDNTLLHLQLKKQELVDIIVKGVNDAVYRGEPAALSRRPSTRRRTALLLAELTKTEEVTDAYLQDITPEFEASLTEEDKTFETTVMISLEALGVLESLKEASEKFKVQIQGQLLEVIDTVSRRIIAEGDADIEGDECERDGDNNDSATESGRPLTRLVQCLSDEFRANALRNNRLLQLWRAALQRHKMSDASLHTEQHYWSAVQQVMQLLLTEYLDISWLAQRAHSAEPAADLRLPDYFAKKRLPRKPARLFTIPPVASSAQPPARRLARSPLVAAPGAARLPAVLPPLLELAKHIPPRSPGTECSLKEFITNYVREGESERLSSEGRSAIDNAMKEASAWRERAPPPAGREHRLIFTCCISSWEAIASVARSAKRCGSFGGSEAARAILPCAAALCAHARAAHSRMVPVTSRAARWLADDDIVRFLQALPNWRVATAAEPVAEDKALEEELRQAYEREAEILGSSLGDGAVARKEIIAEVTALADIALLCESMAWISSNMKSLPSIMSGIKLSDKLHSDLAAAAAIFDEIQQKCLLLLHLEMRIQCFHYLGPAAGGAAPLAHALTSFHEHASPVLSLTSRQYIMNGIGEMMSAGVVWCGVEERDATARLATLRHCLAALSLPHQGLTTAHRYIQLLGEHPEEIIKAVREKGAQFSELEYLNAFKIIGAKRGLSQADMKGYLKQLSSALGHIGVTV